VGGVIVDPTNKDVSAMKAMLKPCASEKLARFHVLSLVNSMRNNTPNALEAV
jgi:hypothetical protein